MGRFTLADAADADLAERAASGDNSAFEELYRRHAQAAWRVAVAVTNNKDDAADAVSDAFTRVLAALPEGRLRDGGSFRAYLLTTTRRAGLDTLRRRGRQQPSGEVPERVGGESPTEKLLQATDNALVAAAFRGLPERWRSVLWLTEVEGVPAKEAAPLLGMSPNGVAQLAVRARAGLRERYLQAHMGAFEVAPACRFTVDRLGAYVAGALSPRDLAKVDQHLAGCEPCRQRQAELEDVGHRLRRIVLPLPLGLGAAALSKWRFAGGHSLAGSVAGRARSTAGWATKLERPLAVMSAALFAAGVARLTIVGEPDSGTRVQDQARGAAGGNDVILQTAPAAVQTAPSSGTGAGGRGAEDLSRERRLGKTAPVDVPNTPDDRSGPPAFDVIDPGPPTPTPPPPPPPPPPQPAAQLQVIVSGGGATTSVAAGDACTGGTVGTQSAGCTPPPSDSDSIVTVITSGSEVPGQQVRLP